MYGYRKRDGLIFPCSSEDVCRVKNGSTNAYLQGDRVVEEFLATIEPNYNQAVADFKEGNINQTAIYTIAGFASYVTSCSPTAMRLGANPLRNVVETTAKLLDKKGLIEPPPKVFGGRSVTEMIADGMIKIEIDQKYPQAVGISQIMQRTGIWGNSRWELIHNEDQDNPFLTNDFASAIELSDDPRLLNRILPLTPDFAVRIIPDLNARERQNDLSFSAFRYKRKYLSGIAIRKINTALAQCGEKLVFFRDKSEWIRRFLGRNSNFWIEPLTTQIPMGSGFMNVSTMRIQRKVTD